MIGPPAAWAGDPGPRSRTPGGTSSAWTAFGEDELVERLEGVSLVGLRSNTTVAARVLERVPDLLAIGAFCIGTNC